MRIPAKALSCLLSCLACIAIAPCSATEAKARAIHPHSSSPVVATRHVGARHTKAHHAAPKLAASAPHDTSNRFLMTQNGKQMTADDFEA